MLSVSGLCMSVGCVCHVLQFTKHLVTYSHAGSWIVFGGLTPFSILQLALHLCRSVTEPPTVQDDIQVQFLPAPLVVVAHTILISVDSSLTRWTLWWPQLRLRLGCQDWGSFAGKTVAHDDAAQGYRSVAIIPILGLFQSIWAEFLH